MARLRRRRHASPPRHAWADDACLRCGLHRREEWLLGDAGPVLALVWSRAGSDLRIRPFPPMLGLVPLVAPTRTREERFGELPVGGEPACPGSSAG